MPLPLVPDLKIAEHTAETSSSGTVPTQGPSAVWEGDCQLPSVRWPQGQWDCVGRLLRGLRGACRGWGISLPLHGRGPVHSTASLAVVGTTYLEI